MIAVRPFASHDGYAWLTLYRECLSHYGEPAAPSAYETSLLSELDAAHGMFSDIAWAGETAVGFTCWVRIFPAGNSFALYLKELFVLEEARGTGAGKALMRNMSERAKTLGAHSIRWETGEASAREFYRKLGAQQDGKTHYTLLADTYDTFAR